MSAMLTQEQFDREAGFRLSLSIMNLLMEESLLTRWQFQEMVQENGGDFARCYHSSLEPYFEI